MSPAPDQILFQISDIHLSPGGPLFGEVDTRARLCRALDAIGASGLRPAALILTGDLVEGGSAEGYRELRALVDRFAEGLGAEVVALPGNHDDVEVMRAELLDGEPFDRVVEIDATRLIALDTTTPGAHHGTLSPEQLDWLAEAVAAAGEGAILALHHTPLPSSNRIMAGLGLRQSAELAEILTGSGVRLVLGGHTHLVAAGTIGGVPVWNGPALVYAGDPLAPDTFLRARREPGGLSRIDVFDGVPVATFVALPDESPPLYEHSEVELIEQMAELGSAG